MTDDNPYAPPLAPIGEAPPAPPGTRAEDEALRRRYLGHESSVRSIGSLHYLAAVIGGIGLFAAFASIRSVNGPEVVGLLAYLALVGFHGVLGFGLDRLKPWARWVEVALVGLSLLGIMVGSGQAMFYVALNGQGDVSGIVLLFGFVGLILGYVLYLLLSGKAAVVFSPEYRDVIARTPHVKYRTSLLVWFVFLVVVAVPVIGMIFAAISRVWR